MSLEQLTKKWDAKKLERDKTAEHLASLDREVEDLGREIASELGLSVSSRNGSPSRKSSGGKGAGTPRLTKERVHGLLASADKGMTMEELTAQVENDPAGYKREGLSDRLELILKEVGQKKGNRYQAKSGFVSKRGRGK